MEPVKLVCKELGISQRTLQSWKSGLTPREYQRPYTERSAPKKAE